MNIRENEDGSRSVLIGEYEGIDKGKRFTGTMVGLYVIDEHSEKRTYGKFHYFYYK